VFQIGEKYLAQRRNSESQPEEGGALGANFILSPVTTVPPELPTVFSEPEEDLNAKTHAPGERINLILLHGEK
jgi:hypothetical protein